MKQLTWDTSFQRAFKRRTRKNPTLQERIFQVLDVLTEDPFHPILKTHTLSGQLKGW